MTTSRVADQTMIHDDPGILSSTISVLLGCILLAVAARVVWLLPFTPVPVTAQTFAVLLIGGLLGSRHGTLAVGIYVLLGTLEVPLFAGGGAGLAWLAGPTGGYLIGMMTAAWLVGRLTETGGSRGAEWTLLAMAAGSLVIYAAGLLWLLRFVPASGVLAAGLYPFVAGDLVKLLAAGAVAGTMFGYRARRQG